MALAPVVTFGAAEVVAHAAATVARSAKPRFGITILEGRERDVVALLGWDLKPGVFMNIAFRDIVTKEDIPCTRATCSCTSVRLQSGRMRVGILAQCVGGHPANARVQSTAGGGVKASVRFNPPRRRAR